MGLQTLKRWGMIPQWIGRGASQTLEPMGKSQMLKGKPINCQLPILSFVPSHPKVVELVNAW